MTEWKIPPQFVKHIFKLDDNLSIQTFHTDAAVTWDNIITAIDILKIKFELVLI